MLTMLAMVGVMGLTGEPPAIGQAALMDSLRSLPTKRSPYGSMEHIEGLARTEELILGRLRAMGYVPTTQDVKWALPRRDQADAPEDAPGSKAGADAITPAEPRIWRNIVADLPGAKAPREVLIVGAHFDAVQRSPGADDNGTGTAALLEIASVLHGTPRNRTIRFIFFNLEEVGLVGSQTYVNRWRTEQMDAGSDKAERIIGMISLEMLGYYTDAPESQKSPIKAIPGVFEPSTVGDFIAIVGLQQHQGFSRALAAAMQEATPGIKITLVDFLPLPVPDMARSDHAPFWLAGQPAVMMTDTANFRNPHYHKATDTIDTIDAARFTLVAESVARAVAVIADQESPAKP
jgi:hypothetical protein